MSYSTGKRSLSAVKMFVIDVSLMIHCIIVLRNRRKVFYPGVAIGAWVNGKAGDHLFDTGGGEAVGVGDAAFGSAAGSDPGGFAIDADEVDTEAAEPSPKMYVGPNSSFKFRLVTSRMNGRQGFYPRVLNQLTMNSAPKTESIMAAANI